MEQPTKTIRLDDSGRDITIRPLNISIDAMLRRQIHAEMPPPEPPMQEVDLGEGNIKHEPNLADPTYMVARAEWNAKVNEELGQRLLRLWAHRALVDPTNESEVDEYLDDLRLVGVEALPDDDPELVFWRSKVPPDEAMTKVRRQVWLYNIVCVSQRDYRTLRDAIFSISRPAEGAVAAHAASFRR